MDSAATQLAQMQQQLANMQAAFTTLQASQPSSSGQHSQARSSSASILGQPNHPATSSPSPITLYQSARTASQPTPMPGQSSLQQTRASSQPFLGVQNLAVDYTRHVNQARLAHAAESQPRQTQLPRRGSRRPRGPAIAPPSLAHLKPDIRQCITELFPANGGPAEPAFRTMIKVYPPAVCLFCLFTKNGFLITISFPRSPLCRNLYSIAFTEIQLPIFCDKIPWFLR